jgi:hypothetical protein
MLSKLARQSQLELRIQRPREPDRNLSRGGRSFYFFDFDDNVAFLTTPTYLFHKQTRAVVELSSGDFTMHSHAIGESGVYADYEIDLDEESGSFRNFRDQDHSLVERWLGKKQRFVEDLAEALGIADFHWKGPSWSCFYHATYNQRPISVITARGHAPQTIQRGIELFVEAGHLPHPPNFLSIYPVSHKATRAELGDPDFRLTVPALKKAAIRASVHQALRIYGEGPHRFGMSDDDPRNIELIIEEMARLKAEFKEMSFFVIETHQGHFIKREVFSDHLVTSEEQSSEQLALFEEP